MPAMETPVNDNQPPTPGSAFMVPIVGVIVDDGRVVLTRPLLGRSTDEGPTGDAA